MRKPTTIVIVALAMMPLAAAQERPEGIRFGRGTLSPSVYVETSSDDNLFSELQSVQSTDILRLRPQLVWRLPLSRSEFSLDYEPGLKQYSGGLLPSAVDHELTFEMQMAFRSGVAFEITNTLERATRELRDLTGGEATFAGDRFTRNDFAGGITFPVGQRQDIELGGFFGTVRFSNPENAAFFDFTDSGIVAAWSLDLKSELRYRVEARAGQSTQQRQPLETTNLATDESVFLVNFQEDDVAERSIRSGIEGSLGERLTVSILAGYGELLFEGSEDLDYRGLVMSSQIGFDLGRSMEIELAASREGNPSSFNVANFFVTEIASARWSWKSPRRMEVSAGFLRQKNSYKDAVVTDLDRNPGTGQDDLGNDVLPNPSANFVAGVFRVDRADFLEATLEFAFIPQRFSMYVTAQREERESNISFFGFDRTVFSLGLRFGWLP